MVSTGAISALLLPVELFAALAAARGRAADDFAEAALTALRTGSALDAFGFVVVFVGI